jgi:hypothetical protein
MKSSGPETAVVIPPQDRNYQFGEGVGLSGRVSEDQLHGMSIKRSLQPALERCKYLGKFPPVKNSAFEGAEQNLTTTPLTFYQCSAKTKRHSALSWQDIHDLNMLVGSAYETMRAHGRGGRIVR